MPHNSIIIKGLGFSEKVQGAALRYHLRRALEKSKDINDFKYHFSQKATHYPFNNATKEIIKRITNDVLEAINNPNELKLKTMHFENGNLRDNEAITQTIKEFGENYQQFYHKGSEAIEHLLQKRSGQVAGAFYREDLGDITLVWGDSKAGLEHILQRRTQDFLMQKYRKLLKSINRNVSIHKVESLFYKF